MTARNPLVVVSGELKELPSGDTLPLATTSLAGVVELATGTETTTGTDTVRAVTPYGLNRVNTWIESRRRWGILNGGGDLGDTTGWVRYSDR